MVPLALYVLPAVAGSALDAHQVTGLVLVQTVASGLGGGAGFYRRGHLAAGELARSGWLLAAGGLAGGLLSAALPARALVLLLALATSAAAALLLTRPRAEAGATPPHARLLASACLAGIGVLGGAIGIGAGFLIIPILVYVLGRPGQEAGGTALVLGLFLALPALLGKAVTGQVPPLPALLVFATALAGSATGARLGGRLPPIASQRALGALAVLLAARLWVGVV